MKNTSLFIHGKKFSGNAEHIDQKTKRVLHHGTLLVESNLDLLDKICQIRNNKYFDWDVISKTLEIYFEDIINHQNHNARMDKNNPPT